VWGAWSGGLELGRGVGVYDAGLGDDWSGQPILLILGPYRGTSLMKKRLTPREHHRALGIGLLIGS